MILLEIIQLLFAPTPPLIVLFETTLPDAPPVMILLETVTSLTSPVTVLPETNPPETSPLMSFSEIIVEPSPEIPASSELLLILTELPLDTEVELKIAFSTIQPELVCSFQPALNPVKVIDPPLKRIGLFIVPFATRVQLTSM
jgi:hypothetical protein